MKLEVIFHPEALLDFKKSFRWYSLRNKDLGVRFEIEVGAILEKIKLHPEYYSHLAKGYRQALLKGFPFVVSFKIIDQDRAVFIASIFHTSRNPKGKYRRMPKA